MSHGFVVLSLEMKLDLVTVPAWRHVLFMTLAETCVRPTYENRFGTCT